MRTLLFKLMIPCFLILGGALQAYAADPVLNFSDITGGPSTGLGDGKGSGAVVTIWGNNLGSSQGTSKVFVGGVEAAYVYYWGNADRSSGAGPADLYTYHKMQTIAFSVAATAANGLGDIHVVVGGVTSNSLPFTVRPGRILHIKTTGSDVATGGSWSSPWKTLSYVGNGPTLSAGDTIYVGDGVQALSSFILQPGTVSGTSTAPISFIAYPGASVLAQGSGVAIGNHNNNVQWVNISKFVVKTNNNGIDTFTGTRIIGNEMTNSPGGCADGQGGAVEGNNMGGNMVGGGIKVLGNYVHDFGCNSTNKLHHIFYISNRGGTPQQSYELGWNFLNNNKAYGALHNYDEGPCGDWVGPMLEHDNVIVNQVGEGIGEASGGSGSCFTMPLLVYNNIFINAGQENSPSQGHAWAASFQGVTNKSNIKIYNNTFYGYGMSTEGGLLETDNCGCTIEWVNNLVVDTLNRPFESPQFHVITPSPHTNNLWYNGGDGNPSGPPSWDSNPLTSNPMFVNPAGHLFTLQQSSPAINAGANAGPMVLRDLYGTLRGQSGTAYDIGAVEFTSTVVPSAPHSLVVE